MALIKARNVTIKLAAAGVNTVTRSSVFSTAFSSGVSVVTAKTFEVNEGSQPMDQVNYMGTEASGYQNQDKLTKPKEKAMIKLTVDAEDLGTLYAILYDTVTAVSTTHNTYSQGDAEAAEVDVLAVSSTPVYWATVAQNCQQVSPAHKITGTDGNIEYEIELECLAKDFLGIQGEQ